MILEETANEYCVCACHKDESGARLNPKADTWMPCCKYSTCPDCGSVQSDEEGLVVESHLLGPEVECQKCGLTQGVDD